MYLVRETYNDFGNDSSGIYTNDLTEVERLKKVLCLAFGETAGDGLQVIEIKESDIVQEYLEYLESDYDFSITEVQAFKNAIEEVGKS